MRYFKIKDESKIKIKIKNWLLDQVDCIIPAELTFKLPMHSHFLSEIREIESEQPRDF